MEESIMWNGGETPHQKRASLAGQQVDFNRYVLRAKDKIELCSYAVCTKWSLLFPPARESSSVFMISALFTALISSVQYIRSLHLRSACLNPEVLAAYIGRVKRWGEIKSWLKCAGFGHNRGSIFYRDWPPSYSRISSSSAELWVELNRRLGLSMNSYYRQ